MSRAAAPELVRFECVRPDCHETIHALPGSTAVCGKHPRPSPMKPNPQGELTP